MDVETGLPLFYPLRYLVDHLAFRSLSTQSASLQAIKFFYEFWYQKYGVTFCYSFYQSEHNPLIAIQEISAFFHYLESGHVYQANVMLLASHSTASRLTNAERVRAVIRFLSFLVNTYVSPMYMKGSPEELSRLSLQLNTKLMICRDEFSVLARGKRAKNSDSHQGFRSLTAGMVRAVYEIIAPNTGSKTNPLNPFPAGEIQFRNFLIVRLLLNYGLRISELLLLECRSIKPNIQGDKYSLIVTTIDDEVKDSRGRAPSLKNIYAHRVLELANQDYFFLMTYIEKIRSPMTPYHFIFTSTTRKHGGLSTLSTIGRKRLIAAYVDRQLSPLNLQPKEKQLYANRKTREALMTRNQQLQAELAETRRQLQLNTSNLIEIVKAVKINTVIPVESLLAEHVIRELLKQRGELG